MTHTFMKLFNQLQFRTSIYFRPLSLQKKSEIEIWRFQKNWLVYSHFLSPPHIMNGFFPFYGEAICLSTIHLPTYIYIYLVLNSDPKEIHRGKKHWNGNPKDKIQTYCLTIALWTLAISKAAGFRSCQLCPEGPIHTQNHSNIRVKHE